MKLQIRIMPDSAKGVRRFGILKHQRMELLIGCFGDRDAIDAHGEQGYRKQDLRMNMVSRKLNTALIESRPYEPRLWRVIGRIYRMKKVAKGW